jgi:hypothetical protein
LHVQHVPDSVCLSGNKKRAPVPLPPQQVISRAVAANAAIIPRLMMRHQQLTAAATAAATGGSSSSISNHTGSSMDAAWCRAEAAAVHKQLAVQQQLPAAVLTADVMVEGARDLKRLAG